MPQTALSVIRTFCKTTQNSGYVAPNSEHLEQWGCKAYWPRHLCRWTCTR